MITWVSLGKVLSLPTEAAVDLEATVEGISELSGTVGEIGTLEGTVSC